MQPLELVDKYIDNELTVSQTRELESDLEHDADLQQLLDSVTIARQAVRTSAITLKVNRLHSQYIDELRTEDNKDKVRPMPVTRSYPWIARIAATVLIGLLGYQYISLNTSSLYQAKFISYQLPTTRGREDQSSNLNSFYLAGNYQAVSQEFETLRTKTPSDYFLGGVAYLQLKKYESAITAFSALRRLNKQRTEVYFSQETDYYLALAYLGTHRTEEAYGLFKTIHETPRHLFSQSVTEFDLLKLNLLRFKE